MKTYSITNPTTGADSGTYTGETPASALNHMAQDAGYKDYADCCEDVPAPDGGLRVTETEEWCPAEQGYRRTVGGLIAWVRPGLMGQWAWSIKGADGSRLSGTAKEIPDAKAAADAALAT